MTSLKLAGILSLGLVAAAAALPAAAQTQPGTLPAPSTAPTVPPAVKTPAPSDSPAASGDTRAPKSGDATKGATAPAKTNEMVGLPVFGADGERVGQVAAVKADASGKVSEIEVSTGGFLGFGSKTIKIPSEKATNAGRHIQLSMTSEQVKQLAN